MCFTVIVEDDVWNIQERQAPQTISIHPNPASVLVNMSIPAEMTDATYTIFNGIGAVVTRGDVQNKELVLNVSESFRAHGRPGEAIAFDSMSLTEDVIR